MRCRRGARRSDHRPVSECRADEDILFPRVPNFPRKVEARGACTMSVISIRRRRRR